MTHHHESLPGLLSDRQIRELSYFPTLEGLMQELRENHNWLLTNLSHVEDDTQRENIIRKAAQHRLDNWRKPMIEPFEPTQVRYEQHNPFGSDDVPVKPIVSYGTSSYGYDVRCAREFKVFTNIHSTIVDPKSFDPNSFVDIEADHCIIPPNSFALARTMEYIRVPDDVLVVCLGKSTYARCFSGDTKVALVDGTTATFEEMVVRAEAGERFWGYSVNHVGQIVVAELIAPKKIGRDRLLEITLDNGSVIRATPDHEFMARNGTYVQAKDLEEGMSLMPLYRTVQRGYEGVYQPTTGRMISTHQLADSWNLVNGVYEAGENEHRHHADHDRRNNKPTNIGRLPASEHIAHHNDERKNWTAEQRAEHGQRIADALAAFSEDTEWAERYSASQKRKANSFWHDAQYADARERVLTARLDVSQETRDKHRASMIARYQSPEILRQHSELMKKAWANDPARKERQAGIARMINIRNEITDAVVRAALKAAGTIRGAAAKLGCDRSVFRRFPDAMSEFAGGAIGNNHKVVSIKELEGEHDVFCLTVPTHGNFALEGGIFVKNCGIIVNVTPLEPGWEGHVTLEFSNTTPLPAKIYAGEGVAQFLFFKGSEPCATTYASRSGKYQGQTGVTLPRT